MQEETKRTEAMRSTPAAQALARTLAQRENDRVVLAESCTGGMAAALLTQIAGISNHFCGSVVTYREKSKTDWLAIAEKTIALHTAESEETTEAMALGVLQKTPEATISGAITGHLGPGTGHGGPGIDAERDGQVFIGVARRDGEAIRLALLVNERLAATGRIKRQAEAAQRLLDAVNQVLQS